MAKKAKFTQTVTTPPDVFVTSGKIGTAVSAFDSGIFGGGQSIPQKGYGDLEVPGERDINISRGLGADGGAGVLQKFVQRKRG